MSEKLYTVVVHHDDGQICCMDMQPCESIQGADKVATMMHLAFPMHKYKVYELKEVKE